MYPKFNKLKGFKKPVISIFAEVRFLVKQLKKAVIPNKNIWDSIAMVIVIEVLHKDFEYITLGLLGQSNNKSIDKI